VPRKAIFIASLYIFILLFMPTTALHIIHSLTAFGIAGSTGYSLELAFVANEAISRVNYCQPAYTLTRLCVSLSALLSQLFVGFSCCFVQPCVSLDAASIITLDQTNRQKT